MKNQETAPQIVSLYLRQAKQLCLLVGQKHQLNTDTCVMNSSLDEDPAKKEKRLKQLVDTQLQIDEQVKRLIEMELKEKIGISRLDSEITTQPAVYIAAVILLIMKLNPSLKRHLRTAGELIEVAAGPTEDSLLVRLALRQHGCLRPFVTINFDSDGLEESCCTMTDQAFSEACWLNGNDEETARAVVSRIEGYLSRRR